MENWRKLPLIAFDLETTGKYPLTSEICEMAAAKWVDGQVVDEFQCLIKPSTPMGEEVIKIHNITNEMVKDAPSIQEKIGEFYDFIQDGLLMAHHSPFDLGFLAYEFERHSLKLPQRPVLCTSLLARKLFPSAPNHRLQTLIKTLDLDGGQAHRALDDAKACLQLGLRCLEKCESANSVEDIVEIQEQEIFWKIFSISDLKAKPQYRSLVECTEGQRPVEIVYEGGSRPGQGRTVHPKGLVLTPNGSFFVAVEKSGETAKRYFVDKISASRE